MKTTGFLGSETAQNLKATCKDVIKQVRDSQIPLVASSLAYTTILSIIPLLAVSFAIFQSFGGLNKLYEVIEPMILENLAHGSGKETSEAIKQFLGKINAGALGATGFVGLILTSMSMLSSFEKAINRIWQTTISRTMFQRISAYWLFITLGPLSFAVIMGVVTSNKMSIKLLPNGTAFFFIAVAAFTAIYKWIPNRAVSWWSALIAACITSGLWNLARFGYAIYTKQFVAYNKIYGSLGAIPIFLVWIYILWIIILSGAAISAAVQKRFDLK